MISSDTPTPVGVPTPNVSNNPSVPLPRTNDVSSPARESPPGHPRLFWATFVLWNIAAVACWAWTHGWMILFAPSALILLAAAALLLWRAFLACVRRPRSVEAIARPILVLGAVFVMKTWGHTLGIMTDLALHQRAWDSTAAAIRSGIQPPPAWQIDKLDPTRIALSRTGVLDHWSGFVHDPSGELGRVIAATGGHWGIQAASSVPVADWFGGTMTGAQPVWGDWYFCWFT